MKLSEEEEDESVSGASAQGTSVYFWTTSQEVNLGQGTVIHSFLVMPDFHIP